MVSAPAHGGNLHGKLAEWSVYKRDLPGNYTSDSERKDNLYKNTPTASADTGGLF